MRIKSWGHAFFSVTMIALGIIGLATGKFTPTWYGVPHMPMREVLAYLIALVSLLTGVGLLVQRSAFVASRVLLCVLLAWLVVVRLPHIVLAPKVLDSWWSSGDAAVMAAGAWVLYVWFSGEGSLAGGERGLRMARILYGLAMIPFGIAHYLNPTDTAGLIPSYLPWHLPLVYITGTAFIVAGIAILTGVYARLAATLSAWQMGLFTLIVWAPMMTRQPNAFQTSEFLDSWALTAGAWMLAESWRGTPWLALGWQQRSVVPEPA